MNKFCDKLGMAMKKNDSGENKREVGKTQVPLIVAGNPIKGKQPRQEVWPAEKTHQTNEQGI